MDLRKLITNELRPWVAAGRLEAETERVVQLLESPERRAVVRTRDGDMHFRLQTDTLVIELPGGAQKVRNLLGAPGGRPHGDGQPRGRRPGGGPPEGGRPGGVATAQP